MGCRVKLYDGDFGRRSGIPDCGFNRSGQPERKISNESPVGAALIGRKIGESVEVGDTGRYVDI